MGIFLLDSFNFFFNIHVCNKVLACTVKYSCFPNISKYVHGEVSTSCVLG
jgi:hypothetical protein